MNKEHETKIGYGFLIFILGMLLWNAMFFLPAFWAAQGDLALAEPIHIAFSFTCHQLDHRSLCYYPNGDYIIASCDPQDEADFAHRDIVIESPTFGTGYKLAVCSRDVGIYFAMLIGGIIWGILNRTKLSAEKWMTPLWLILAIIPIALDGGTQFLGFRESTNELRVITGAIVGIVVPFYLIPLMNQIINPICEDIFLFLRKK